MKEPELNLIDKLLLLALDDEKGTLVSDSLVFGYCLAGAVLFDLSVKGNIEVVEQKVKVKSNARLGHEALDFCMEKILKSKKERKINHWVESLGNHGNSLRKKTVQRLISLEILEEKEDKILWVFTHRKYPTKNETPENVIRQRLHEIIVNDAEAEVDEIMIISLVDACGLNKEVYGKEIAKANTKKIKGIVKDYQFADATGKVIQELHETLMAVIVVMITTTTVTVSS